MIESYILDSNGKDRYKIQLIAMREWKTNLYNGGIPISPFIHPHEKQLRDFAIQEGFSYIRVCSQTDLQKVKLHRLENLN